MRHEINPPVLGAVLNYNRRSVARKQHQARPLGGGTPWGAVGRRAPGWRGGAPLCGGNALVKQAGLFRDV